MAEYRESPLGDGPKFPQNPEVELLCRVIMHAQDLVNAEGVDPDTGKKYLFIGELNSEVMFRFDETDGGYTVTRTK